MLFKLEPILAKLRLAVSLPALLPLSQLTEMLSQLDAGLAESEDPPIPKEVRDFWAHYAAVTRAALGLVTTPPFAALARRYEDQEEEYMPGGPPMSPMYDSYSVLHIIAEVPQGLADETPASVLAGLMAGRPGYETLHATAREIAASHLDLYRVVALTKLGAKLLALRSGANIEVRTSGPFLRDDDLFLGRVLPHVDGLCYIVDSPYLLRANESEWLAYFGRVVKRREEVASATGAQPKPGNVQVKARAKGKKEKKRKPGAGARLGAGSMNPDDVVRRHLMHGLSWRYWPEFIMNGYWGERNGIVYLAGIPDRPATLPHHAAYEGDDPDHGDEDETSAPDEPPDQRLRRKLFRAVERDGTLDEILRVVGGPRRFSSLDDVPERARHLVMAACMFGALDDDERTHLQRYAESSGVPADERSILAAIARGWFSIFEVRRIELDTGLDVLDVLRNEPLFLRERLLTRQMDVGTHLAGWILRGEDEAWRLEGAVMGLPRFSAQEIIAVARAARDDASAHMPGLGATGWLGALAPIVIRAVLDAVDNPTRPRR